MHVQKRSWIVTFIILFSADVCIFGLFILRRPVMTQAQWAFIEKQRPHVTAIAGGVSSQFFLCADCLDYALARRPISGWDPPAHRVEVMNLPSSALARQIFESRQIDGLGTSKSNSDLATVVFVGGAVLECALISTIVSVRFRERRAA